MKLFEISICIFYALRIFLHLMLYAEQAAAHQLHISIFPKHYPLLNRLYKPPILETAPHKYEQNTHVGHYNLISISSLFNCILHTHTSTDYIRQHLPWYGVCTVTGVHQLPSLNLRHLGTVTVGPQPPHQRVAALKPGDTETVML